MDDDLLIQNRFAMLALLEKLPLVRAKTVKAYEFVPGSYAFEVMAMLTVLVDDAANIVGKRK